MATAIHQLHPGSYKTFTLVQRHAISALEQGRVVVTNIRGFDSLLRVQLQFPDIQFPESARIIWVDTTVQANRLKLACFFHWIPFGSLLIIDEVQQIYPDRRDFKLESLDRYIPHPGEIIEEIGLPEGRPEDIFTAYDKQRHYNWDIYLSTPNIAKVKKEIREVSEWAYRHRDISGILPWKKNSWIEHQHDPETSGKSASHCVGNPTTYKADPRIFSCYASTATGDHSKEQVGRSIFKDKKLQLVIVLIFCSIGYFIYGANNFYVQHKEAVSVPNVRVPSIPANASVLPSTHVSVEAHTPDVPPQNSIIETYTDKFRRWLVSGIADPELPSLPENCFLSKTSVKCSFFVSSDNSGIIRFAYNRTCYPQSNKTICFVILARVIEDKDGREAILDKALPI